MDLRLSPEQERWRAAAAAACASHPGGVLVALFSGEHTAPTPTLPQRGEGAFLLSVLAAEELGRHLLRGLVLDTLTAVELAGADGSEPVALAFPPDGALTLDAGLRLSGRARFVAHAKQARRLLVAARDERGAQAVLLLATPRPGLGLRQHDEISRGELYEASFAGAAVGEDEVVLRGRPAAQALERVRWTLLVRQAAYLVGMAAAALDITQEYVRRRQAFGRRLASFQALAFRIAALHVRVEATRLLVRSVAWRAGAGEDVRLLAAQAHTVAAALATDAAAEGVQMHGAYGITDGAAIQRYYRHVAVERVRLGRPADVLDEAAALLLARVRGAARVETHQ